MEVYVLVEYMQQPEFTDCYGEQAAECSAIVGIYDSDEKAQEAKHSQEELDSCYVSTLGCDPSEFVIHRMLVN